MRTRKAGQVAELSLFVILPLVIKVVGLPFHHLYLLLVLAATYTVILLKDTSFDRRRLGLNRYRSWPRLLARFLLFALLLLPVALAFGQGPVPLRQEWWEWSGLVVFYAVFSVVPQALIYRVYFFHRFQGLLKHREWLVVLNATLFSYLHIIYGNWQAMALTLAAGLIFATTYLRSRSLVVTSVEHALYGGLGFLLGLGAYFS